MKYKIFVKFVLVIVWMFVIFYLSSMTSVESNSKSKKIATKLIESTEERSNKKVSSIKESVSSNVDSNLLIKNTNIVIRKCAHVSEYFILYLLLINLFSSLIKNKRMLLYLIGLVICFIYACTDEYHQLFVDGRTGQFIDVLIDTIGPIIAFLEIIILSKITNKKVKFNS